MTWIFGRNLALSVAAAALLVGCGWGSSGDAAKPAAAKPATAKAVSAADQLSRNMVGAVAANKPAALPIQVKFELRDRPQVGQPVELDLAIVPMSASVDRVSGKVEGEEGVEVVEGAQIAPTDRPAEGTPIRQSVKVLPRQDGIFTVHVVVTVDASGTPDLPAKPAGPATAAAVAAAASGRVGEPAHVGTPGTAAAQ